MVKYKLNDGWRFHLGDIKIPLPTKKEPIVSAAKTRSQVWGPSAESFQEESNSYGPNTECVLGTWEVVDLPHDYMISQVPDRNNNEAFGFLAPQNAWYRKRFTLREGECEKRVTLYFEGIIGCATVYVNGCLAGRSFDGHASFELDISDYVYPEKENLIAVYVNTEKHEGWWYPGCGIYRDVWLEISEKVSIDRFGVYLCPQKRGGETWDVPVETTLRNDGEKAAAVLVQTEILGEDDRVIATLENHAEIEPYSKTTVNAHVSVENPRLWDVDDPFLHRAVTRIYADGRQTDESVTRFGFREVRFDSEKGLFLNGRSIKVKGVCNHQDFGLTGVAVPESIQRYKLEMMKEMGANGFRTVHYPHDTATMDALDELGFLVMDEIRWFIANDENIRSLEWLIKRDRNRPSVIMWSMGNEEFITLEKRGQKIAGKMRAAIRRLDKSRPVTMGVSHDPLHTMVYAQLDLIGINYSLEKHDALHQKYPQMPFFVSECCSTGSTRGWYLADCPKRGYINEFDKDREFEWSRSIEETWKHVAARPWICGAFQWTGIEYRGESVWPRVCAQTGAVDLYLQRKAAFYQNRANWTDAPMIYLLPHWNHTGREGEPIYVRAYTNCDEAALYLNDALIGRVAVEQYGHAEWRVAYQAGRLTVKGYQNGVEVASDTRETSGAASALRLACQMEPAADGYALLGCSCVDERGREVPDAACKISFDCDGGTIVATGSDVADHTPPACPDRQMRAGKCAVLVRLEPDVGTATVYASAPGLKTAFLKLENKEPLKRTGRDTDEAGAGTAGVCDRCPRQRER